MMQHEVNASCTGHPPKYSERCPNTATQDGKRAGVTQQHRLQLPASKTLDDQPKEWAT